MYSRGYPTPEEFRNMPSQQWHIGGSRSQVQMRHPREFSIQDILNPFGADDLKRYTLKFSRGVLTL